MAARLKKIDWVLLLALAPLLIAGLITMKSFGPAASGGAGDYFFWRQLIWIAAGFIIFLWFSLSDLRWMFSSLALVVLYLSAVISLILLLLVGNPTRGAVSWFKLGLFSFDPTEVVKIILILILAKYFSRRHIEIANVKHIVISGFYAVLPAILIFLQPDFGSSLILGAIWFAMTMASGISKKHFFILIASAAAIFAVCWFFILAPYQRLRIYSFLNPYLDPRGSGYHTIQTTIAVGAGGVWGRGIGLGSQSRLEFLPEHRTDFIFAAIGEELGFVGVVFLIIFFTLLIFRIIKMAAAGNENFIRLYATGFAILLISQFLVHTGMNVGLLPITGVPLPLVSYGGSSLITFFASLGILMSMRAKSTLPRHIHAPI